MMNGLHWAQPQYFYWGIVFSILLLVVFYYYSRWNKSKLAHFGSSALNRLKNSEKFVYKKYYGYWVIIPLLLGLTLANPQVEKERKDRKIMGTDIMVLLDISRSMLCLDVPPSRLEKAQQFGIELINRLRGNRMGLVFFAGGAIKKSPLTLDYKILHSMIGSAHPSQAALQGTNIADAIKLSYRDDIQEDKYVSAIVIITDGEAHDELAFAEVEKAAERGISIYVVGVGTEKGGWIPDAENPFNSFRLDVNGERILTKLDVEVCRKLAKAGKGKAYILNDINTVVSDIEKEVKQFEQSEQILAGIKTYESYYFYFLIPALITMIFLTFQERKI
jgi:Ca-activated chloride channel family protein